MDTLREHLAIGHVIPALPLPLHEDRSWSERYQRALVRYYLAAGAGGLAVGVHSTQFEIREPGIGLYEPVLRLARQEITTALSRHPRDFTSIAGVCGRREQATDEARLAASLGYDAALLSMRAVAEEDDANILAHCRAIADVLPVIGFYLQPAVGGRFFSYDFWRGFFDIENVVAIKIAPFDRYATWDVVRAVMDAGRKDIALYTGNDDNIVVDLLTEYQWQGKRRRIAGGLLGHWGVWTRAAVDLLVDIKQARQAESLRADWLHVNQAVTDMNAAVFDTANGFAGCIPGIMEVLRRQGLVPSRMTLQPGQDLSPGQAEELDRVCAAYPQFTDDDFVTAHLQDWLA